MTDRMELIDIVRGSLGTFDHRRPFTPGMFEPLKPLFRDLGYVAAAVYIADDYPDRMNLVSAFGRAELFPAAIALGGKKSLLDEAKARLRGLTGLMVERLFSHDRELGVLVAASPGSGDAETRRAFDVLAESVSVMAYVERIRTNDRRERQEREIFFAQSLTSRLMPREAPRLKELKIGFEFIRSLAAGGDFFDFIPLESGALLGVIGCCNGKGQRTVLEVMGIMQAVHRSLHMSGDLAEVLAMVNDYLVRERRRAHQSSLAVFRADPAGRRLTVAKSGRMEMLLCGPGAATRDISAPGAMFLGMLDEPDIHHGDYDFQPGQALLCVTEGVYSSSDGRDGRPGWFMESVASALESRRRKPLANAVFDSAARTRDQALGPDVSLAAVSVEFAGRNRESLRVKAS